MKLGTHVLSEVLNWTISILLAQPTKKVSYRDFFQDTNGLILKVYISLIPWDNGLIFTEDKATRKPLFVN